MASPAAGTAGLESFGCWAPSGATPRSVSSAKRRMGSGMLRGNLTAPPPLSVLPSFRLSVLLQRKPPVHHDRLSGDVARFVRAEEPDHFRHVQIGRASCRGRV